MNEHLRVVPEPAPIPPTPTERWWRAVWVTAHTIRVTADRVARHAHDRQGWRQ